MMGHVTWRSDRCTYCKCVQIELFIIQERMLKIGVGHY